MELKFSLTKSVLLGAFGFVKNSLPPRTTNPILKTLFIKTDDQGISFRCNNRLSESHLMLKGAESQKQGEVCVDSIILDVIRFFEDGEISIDFSGKKFVISQGKNKHQINWMDPKDFPQKMEVGNYVEYNPSSLFSVISRLKLTLGAGTQKPFDKSYFFNPHEKLITTGDGTSVSLWEGIEYPGNIAMPYGDMLTDALGGFTLSEKDQFYISLGQPSAFKVIGENIDREFVFAGFTGDYSQNGIKAIRKSKDVEPALIIKVQKDTLVRKLSMCKAYSDRSMTDGKDNATTIKVEEDAVRLTMQMKGLADMDEELVCESIINDPEFLERFHPGTLLEAVNQCGQNVELRFYGKIDPFILLDQDTPNYTYLQTAMVMSKEVTKKKESTDDNATKD